MSVADAAMKLKDGQILYNDLRSKSEALIAPKFAQETANDPGSFVVYTDGKVYFLESGHTAGTSWENTTKAETNIGAHLGQLKRALNEVETEADTLSDMLTEVVETPVAVTLTVQTNGYYNTSGTFVSTTDRAYAIVDGVHAGDKYILSTFVRPVTIAGLIMFAGTTFYGYNYLGTGADQDIVDAQFTIPNTVTKIIVQSAKDSKPPTLKKVVGTQVSKSYTKEESRALIEGTPQKYGVRWSVTDTNDLGQRCFNAVGLSATIGIGSTNGSSDFDSIYPWSDIKRCNIKANTNGAFVVTYEGETGFALDGTNGDVFVRIPKFYVDKYIENGYEYRVISAVGTIPHKLFIENGVELDEVFIGAYEGYSNGTVLKSISSVIPSSNMTTAQFLALAQANGDNYSLFDMRCVDAIWTLMAVEYGCRNSNQILGYGIADYMQPIYSSYQICTLAANNTNTIRTGKWSNSNKAYMPVGSNMTICGSQNQETIIAQRKIVSVSDGTDYTDWTFDGDPINVDTNCFIGSAACNTNFIDTCSAPLTWHTGRANYVTGGAATTRNPVRYRWIENPVGNLWHFLPDAIFKNLQMYVCENMADYDVSQLADEYKPIGALMTAQESNGLKTDETGSNYWITNLLNDPFAKGSCIGKTASTAITSVKAFGGYYYMYNRDNLVTIAHGGGFDHLYRCNMLTNRAWILPTTKWYLYGARLMFKKVS